MLFEITQETFFSKELGKLYCSCQMTNCMENWNRWGKEFPLNDSAPECGNHLGNVWLMPLFSPLPSINFHHASLAFQDSGWLSLLPIPISFGTRPFYTIPTLCAHQFMLTIFSSISQYKWVLPLFHFLIHLFKASSKFMNKGKELTMSRKIRNTVKIRDQIKRKKKRSNSV